MDGTRGAKGSINDRIISMLYRSRHNKYKLKRANHVVSKVEPKKNYVVNDLKTEENYVENINYIRCIPKYREIAASKVNNLNFNANSIYEISENVINSQNKSKKIPDADITIIKKINIEILPFVVSKAKIDNPKINFESKKIYGIQKENKQALEEHNEKNNLKKDKAVVIVKKVRNTLEKINDELDEFTIELEKLEEEKEEAITKEKMVKVMEKYNKLKEQIQNIINKINIIRYKYNFEDYELLENLVLTNATIEYKKISNMMEIELLVNKCKNQIIDTIEVLDIYEKTNEMEDPIKIRNQKISKRDKEISDSIVNMDSIDDVNKMLEKEAIYQKKILNNIRAKMFLVRDTVTISDTILIHTNSMLGSFLRIAAGVLTMPLTKSRAFPNMLGMNLINKGMKNLNDTTIVEKTRRENIYYDLEDEIFNSRDCLRSAENILDDAYDEILLLEYNFDSKYGNLSGKLKEYDEAKEKMNKLKKCLNERKQELNSMNKSLEISEELNKQKVKVK